jgi:hypothetical protein
MKKVADIPWTCEVAKSVLLRMYRVKASVPDRMESGIYVISSSPPSSSFSPPSN